ncbi:MAG: hypothetical protein LUI06_10475 [Ruminococcus sp.]|nr:hypothetical protein [Ruminococcus sp.]
MLELNVFSIKLRFYFGFFAVIFVSFFFGSKDSLGILAALTCCLLHELGHLSAMCLLSTSPDKICFYAGGIKIIPHNNGIESREVQTIILAAGCAVNFIFAIASKLLGFNMLYNINLCLGIFNLLPFSYFDGGRILELYLPHNIKRIFALICTILLIVAFFSVNAINPAILAVFIFVSISEIFM